MSHHAPERRLSALERVTGLVSDGPYLCTICRTPIALDDCPHVDKTDRQVTMSIKAWNRLVDEMPALHASEGDGIVPQISKHDRRGRHGGRRATD